VKKNAIKISLDVVMFLLLILMYNSTAFGLGFHEIGGLAVCGLSLVHKALNWRWISGVTRKLFARSASTRIQVGYAVGVLLLLAVVFIAASGILISRIAFPGLAGTSRIWLVAHCFSSALALILSGVHIGLHWSFLRAMFSRLVRLPRLVAKPLGVICLAALLIYGGYSAATSGFASWLASPVTGATLAGLGAAMLDRDRATTPQPGSLEVPYFDTGEVPPAGTDGTPLPGGAQRPQRDPSAGAPVRPGGGPGGIGGGFATGRSFSTARALTVAATYGSIVGLFAALTALAEWAFGRRAGTITTSGALT